MMTTIIPSDHVGCFRTKRLQVNPLVPVQNLGGSILPYASSYVDSRFRIKCLEVDVWSHFIKN